MEHPFLWVAIPLLIIAGIGLLKETYNDNKEARKNRN